MVKIIKCYLDIGCSYQGEETIQNIYKDIENWNIKDCGIISILKLEINKEEKTSKDILFKQVLSPMYHKFQCSIDDYRIYSSCILKEFNNVDLFVTFNGRDFDIPIIINNLNLSEKQKNYYTKFFAERDRDLLDWCILKNISTKGGLREIAENLNTINKGHTDVEQIYEPIGKYNYYLTIKKRKNEKDIRILPLLEKQLGLLYEPRSYADKYHKRFR